ncbi:MAG: SMC-Scp complex subunit ScpB [Eubacteriaceae bacterium]|nr:SMC-Scp complex subunit ScpB [Eubacteriaceae bacterium]
MIKQSKIFSAALEAILFASGEPVSIRAIASALNIPIGVAEELAEKLKEDYAAGDRGLEISVADGYAEMQTSPEVFEYVKEALGVSQPHALSQAAVETLAIIAYKQPVARSDIERIRGVKSSSSLDVLIAKGLVKETGKFDLPGKPSAFSTTREFLTLMNIKSLSELPSYEDFAADAALETEPYNC